MPSADLSVSKTASPSTVSVGQQFTYTMTIENHGPDAATGVILTDPVPTNACLNAIATSPQVGNYTYTGNTIKWNIGSLSVNASVTLTATVTALAAGALVNTSTVIGNEPDPNPNNNTSTTTVTVTGSSAPSADLGLWKESCPPIVTAGTTFTYFLSAINNGPSQANDVFVTDPLPPGLIPLSATSSKGVCTISGNNVICQIGTLNLNERVNITINVKPIATDTFQNSAFISSNNLVPDPNPGNNMDSAITQVIAAADLAITKTASSETVFLGEVLTYTILVTNDGPSDATSVTVTDSLSPNVTLVSIVASQGTGCTPMGNSQYLCSLGTLANGAVATITILVKPTEPGCITNTASVSSGTTELDLCNNTTSTCTLVKRNTGADLVITKTHTPEQVTLCTPVTYTLTVTNIGPSPATGIVLVDQLPANVTLLSVCSSQGHCCNRCGNELSCLLGTLAVGASATVHIKVKPCQLGVITNTGIVTANEEDANPDNNQMTDTLTVITLSAQVESLISLIHELAASGVLSEEYADCLLANLQNLKQAIICGNLGNASYFIEYFIKTIDSYITNKILSPNVACPLIKLAEAIKEQLDCPQMCLKEGDEYVEPS